VVLCSIGAWNNFEESVEKRGISEISRISSVISMNDLWERNLFAMKEKAINAHGFTWFLRYYQISHINEHEIQRSRSTKIT